MKTEYNKKILERLKTIPKFSLGELVKTSDGEGIVVKLNMDWNGLYIREETASATVWYGTSEAQNGWVSKEYKLTELNTNKIN